MNHIQITEYVRRQSEAFFPDSVVFLDLQKSVEQVLTNKLYFQQIKMWVNAPFLDVLNSIQYPIFLYKLSRELFETGDIHGAKKIFYLNKALHGIDLFYEIKLGDRVLLSHCVGSTFCKATYGDYSLFYHGTLIGTNGNDRPVLNDGLVMFAGSKIIGKCVVGVNAVISANVTIINQNIPANVMVFQGKGRDLVFKDIHEFYADRYFIRTMVNGDYP